MRKNEGPCNTTSGVKDASPDYFELPIVSRSRFSRHSESGVRAILYATTYRPDHSIRVGLTPRSACLEWRPGKPVHYVGGVAASVALQRASRLASLIPGAYTDPILALEVFADFVRKFKREAGAFAP